ncbi:MAG: proprotein convertase P-domain-containing protein [Thermoanaerobaculia bacterium]
MARSSFRTPHVARCCFAGVGLALFCASAPALDFATLVYDICPGPGQGVPNTALIGVAGPLLLVAGNDCVNGYEPWTLDAAAHTGSMVENIMGSGDGVVTNAPSFPFFVPLGEQILFYGDDGFAGLEMWVSDGTPGGTSIVEDMNPGAGGTTFETPLVSRDVAFFIKGGIELWKTTDGTDAGTGLLQTQVKELSGLFDKYVIGVSNASTKMIKNDGVTTSDAALGVTVTLDRTAEGAQYKSRFFFNGNAAAGTDIEPWSTDGTTGVRLSDIAPGAANSTPIDFTVHRGKLYFVAGEPTFGRELYVYDGTTLSRLTDVNPANANGVSAILGSIGPLLLFVGNDGSSGNELWATTGAPGGEYRVRDFDSSSGSSMTAAIGVTIGERAYVVASEPSGERLYVTDGTSAGTIPVAADVAHAGTLVAAGDRLYMRNAAAPAGQEIWSVDLFNQVGLTACSTPHTPIPDSDADGAINALWIDQNVVLSDLEVSVDIEHQYVSDLAISLTHVDSGTTIGLLAVPSDCNGNDVQLTFSDRAAAVAGTNCTPGSGDAWPRFSTWRPTSALSAFAGQGTAGKWVLTVEDQLGSDLGVLHSWCLRFRAPAIISDGFESGTLGGWSSVTPASP